MASVFEQMLTVTSTHKFQKRTARRDVNPGLKEQKRQEFTSRFLTENGTLMEYVDSAFNKLSMSVSKNRILPTSSTRFEKEKNARKFQENDTWGHTCTN